MELRSTMRGYVVESFLFGDEAAMTTDQGSLMDAGIIDSTGIMEILGFLEETVGIAVEDEELVPENFDSIDGLVGLVERKTGRAAQA
ncbi:acyl carrier protein [bacterium]|nr:acyl carrier protein [bacterium]